MLSRSRFCRFLIPSLISATSFALPPKKKETHSAKDLGLQLQSLEKKHQLGSQSFSVKVSQELYSAVRKQTKTSRGIIEFAPFRQFRWEMSVPGKGGDSKQIYVSNGKDLWQFNSVTKLASHLSANRPELEVIDYVTKPATLLKKYSVEDWPTNDPEAPKGGDAEALRLKLSPKAGGDVRSLYLIVNQKTGWVEELKIVYQYGNKTNLVFEDYVVGAIAKSRFNFVPPPGAIIDK